MRIHNGCNQNGALVDFQELGEVIFGIKDRLGDGQEQQHFEQVKKKVTIIKEELDRMVQIHEEELKLKLRLKLNSGVESIINRIDNKGEGETPTGSEVSLLLGSKVGIYEDYDQKSKHIKWIKKDIMRALELLEQSVTSKC